MKYSIYQRFRDSRKSIRAFAKELGVSGQYLGRIVRMGRMVDAISTLLEVVLKFADIDLMAKDEVDALNYLYEIVKKQKDEKDEF